MQFLDIGFGNLVSADRIVSILPTNSAPTKRILAKIRERDQLFDATCRRACQAAVVTDNGQIYLSYLKPKTLGAKLLGNVQIEDD